MVGFLAAAALIVCEGGMNLHLFRPQVCTFCVSCCQVTHFRYQSHSQALQLRSVVLSGL